MRMQSHTLTGNPRNQQRNYYETSSLRIPSHSMKADVGLALQDIKGSTGNGKAFMGGKETPSSYFKSMTTFRGDIVKAPPEKKRCDLYSLQDPLLPGSVYVFHTPAQIAITLDATPKSVPRPASLSGLRPGTILSDQTNQTTWTLGVRHAQVGQGWASRRTA